MNHRRTQPVDNPLLDARSSRPPVKAPEPSKRAACVGLGDLFYPSNGYGHSERVKTALAICAACPVRGPCEVKTSAEPNKYLYVGMVRAGRYYRVKKTGRDTEGAI